ncbi:probable folate-biopterin transporter 8, chloroplastic [Mercurialis annua]|uniref:probable folate-biopterin transporter 8, chloroplastic n=1 Tax=Mercurialis annua TaxID=3986 RepID=UPI00215FDFBE|nr:probable folate-biopterin transporter 8, chloroplastic [Mercurialis annua]
MAMVRVPPSTLTKDPKNPRFCIHTTKLSHLCLKPIQCSFSNLNAVHKPVKPVTQSPVFSQVGGQQMVGLSGFGYWVQGFRCFPWLALNFHMANHLNLHPSVLQLVQHSGNLPMVAKPLYGILSDAFYIGGAHRLPYILIGVLLQVLSWAPLALIPAAREGLPSVLACILLGNLGASIAEVANDALVAEYGQKHRMKGLQSYGFMALAVGGILGNLFGGCFLLKTLPKNMFLVFACLLSFQLAISSTSREDSLGISQPAYQNLAKQAIWENIKKQLSDLKMVLCEDIISRPLIWVVASIAAVPALSGSIFCYQIQCLHLDPSIIGLSRVIGQLTLLSMTVLYDRYWKDVPMRKLIAAIQFVYASSLLLDFVLVKQINLRLGIPNEVFACCFSGLSETLAQFKVLPFTVLLASLCPKGCEGSLMSFVASMLCLSSIFSGFLGVSLASMMGITTGDYSSLPIGSLIQFIAALLPLGWIMYIPSQPSIEKERRRGASKRSRRNRRIGRVALPPIFVYRRERESETQR